MPPYEEDDGIQPIAPIQPVNRIQAMRALRVKQTRPYMGGRKAPPLPAHSEVTASDAPEEEEMLAEPAVILDISPQARDQAHHLMEEALHHALPPADGRKNL